MAGDAGFRDKEDSWYEAVEREVCRERLRLERITAALERWIHLSAAMLPRGSAESHESTNRT